MNGFDNDPNTPGSEPNGVKEMSGATCAVMAAFLVMLLLLIISAMFQIGWLALIAMGVMFLIPSVPSLIEQFGKSKPRIAFLLIFVVSGAVMEVCGLMQLLAPKLVGRMMEEHGESFTGGLFIAIGLCFVLSPLYTLYRRKRYCKAEVEATCIDLKARKNNRGRTLYTPVYEFWYGGEMHTVSNQSYTSFGYPGIGETRTIWVDAEYFDEYYERRSGFKLALFLVVFGVAFAGCGVLALVLK